MGQPACTARLHGPSARPACTAHRQARLYGPPARPASTAHLHGPPPRPAGTASPPGLWAMSGQLVDVHVHARLGPSFKWAGTVQHIDPLSPRKVGPSRPSMACWTGPTRVMHDLQLRKVITSSFELRLGCS